MDNFTTSLGAVSGSPRLQLFSRTDNPNEFNRLDMDEGEFLLLAERPGVYGDATVRGDVF